MIIRYVLSVILLTSLLGCATLRKPTAASQLQIRVSHIENQLDDQDETLSQLKSTVDELSLRSQPAKVSARTSQRIQKTAAPRIAKPATSQSSPSTPAHILRVPVTPQEVQTGLKNAGYYTGSIDGRLGSGSKRAIKEFQTDHDLVSDGIIGKKTWTELKNYLD